MELDNILNELFESCLTGLKPLRRNTVYDYDHDEARDFIHHMIFNHYKQQLQDLLEKKNETKN